MGATRGAERLERGAFAGDLGPVTNVLVQSPAIGGLSSASSLPAFLPADADLSTVRLTAVTYRRSADEWLAAWRRDVGTLPAECLVVGVGDDDRSAAASEGPAATDGTQAPYDVRVVHPEDLTGLGIALSESLSLATDDGAADPTRFVLAYDSVTALLQYVDTERTFRFLHVLTSRVRAAGALGVFFMDPAAHDDRTVRTVEALFDAVVEQDDDGEWIVR